MKAKNISSDETLFVGDNSSDYYAACNAGIDFVLVLTGHGHRSSLDVPAHVPRYLNLLEFALSLTPNDFNEDVTNYSPARIR